MVLKLVYPTISKGERTPYFNFYIIGIYDNCAKNIANNFYAKYFMKPKRLYISIYFFCRNKI